MKNFSEQQKSYVKKFLILGVIVFILAFTIPFGYKIWSIYDQTHRAQNNLEESLELILQQDLKQAEDKINNAYQNLSDAQETYLPLTQIRVLNNFTTLENSMDVVTDLFEISVQTTEMSKKVTQLLQQVQAESLRISKNLTIDDVTDSDNQRFYDLEKLVRELRNEFLIIDLKLSHIETDNIYDQLNSLVTKVAQELRSAYQKVNSSFDIVHAVPHLLGVYEDSKYLVLLLNNTELRPGGGFIGTYGEIEISKGQVKNLFTDDTYNIDNNAIEGYYTEPPIELQRYLKANNWFFRDSNWYPDFKLNAEQALLFYELETGTTHDYDAVIAFNPNAIGKLLDYFGGITYDDITYTSENLVEILQYKVEQEFAIIGIDVSERKDVINYLTQELFAKIKELPFNQILDLALLMRDSFDEKNIMLYHTDTFVQKLFETQNIAGRLNQNQPNILHVSDANLASLKTDNVMKKHIHYVIEPKDNIAQVKVKLTYENTGTFDWKTTRYNSYTRVYIPQEAREITSSLKTPLKINEFLNRTEVGFFWVTEPQTTETVEILYTLPLEVLKNNENLQLYLQKQSGNNSTFSIDVKNSGMIQSVQQNNQVIQLNSKYPLETDTIIEVKL